MRVTVGSLWRELFLESGLGQNPGDLPEAQRLYAALIEAETEMSAWVKLACTSRKRTVRSPCTCNLKALARASCCWKRKPPHG